jgi:hypothetical protein
LEGFAKGIKVKEQQGVVPEGFLDAFIRDITLFSIEDMLDGFYALVDVYDPSAPDIPVIKTHLKEHTSKFHSTLGRLGVL